MKKKPIVKRVPSPKEIKMYHELEFEFILAMSNKDIKTLELLMAENGVFFGNLGKWQALKFLNKEFKTLSKSDVEIFSVKYLFTLGSNPGRRAILFNEGSFPESKGDSSYSLAFVIEVKDDELNKIYLTRHFTDEKKINEIVLKN